jgi:glycosyltransferase involved in cell wall biosynthesis
MSRHPPRVLQAIAGAVHGGAEAFFVRLVPALADAGLEQRVVIRRDPQRAAALRGAGIEPVELAFGGLFDFATKRDLARELAAFAPDIALSWMSRATALCPRGEFVHVARLGGYYDLKYYRACDHLIGNTPDIVAHLRRAGWPAERTHYLPNFVDAAPAAALSRAALGTAETAPLLLALGRLHRNKGFDLLLEALAQLPETQCWLAGEGPERAALEAQAERLGLGARLRLLGWREDAAALYAAADLLVCPSRHEPLGNVVIEAWAHGLPVVAAASVGPASLIEPEENGLLVPLEDPAALAQAIKRVVEEQGLAARLAEGGRAAFAAGYTRDAVVTRYMEFFQQVAA